MYGEEGGSTEGNPSKMSKLGVMGSCHNVAMGLVNGVRTEVLIDSGAELGSVPRELVPVNAQMCGEVIVKGSVGKEQKCESFMADFVAGGFYKRVRAIVDDDSHQGAACIVPFSVTDRCEYEAFVNAIEEYMSEERAEMKVMTRSMATKEREEEGDDVDARNVCAWSVVEPEGTESVSSDTPSSASSRPNP